MDDCDDAALVIVANPNNPDGRLFARSDLLALASDLRRRGGLLVIDEAFMDVAPRGIKSRAGCDRRECHCAPLVRQVFRIGRFAARLCACRSAARSENRRRTWTLGGLRTCNRCRHTGARRHALDRAHTRAARQVDAKARRHACRSGAAACRRHEPVSAGANAGRERALPASGRGRNLGARFCAECQSGSASVCPATRRPGNGSRPRSWPSGSF